MTDMAIQYPWALLLLPLIPIPVLARRRLSPRTAYSAVGLVGRDFEPGVVKKYGAGLTLALFAACTVMALANIQYHSVWEEQYLESKWIMIVQDLSGSMNRPAARERHLTLGDVTLAGARAFIDMRQAADLIGVAGFSSYAKLISPPTFDKNILKEKLDLLNRKKDSIVFRELTAGGATNASYAAWLALSAFFMMLPEKNQLSHEELKDLRHALLGKTMQKCTVPEKLARIRFGRGMAIVMFTDGRIEANTGNADIRRGLPNFVNVLTLIRALGIKFYLIIAGGEVAPEIAAVIEGAPGQSSCGRIFHMPRAFDAARIKEVYREINDMEKNSLLVKMTQKKKDTRPWLTALSLVFLLAHCFFKFSPGFGSLT